MMEMQQSHERQVQEERMMLQQGLTSEQFGVHFATDQSENDDKVADLPGLQVKC